MTFFFSRVLCVGNFGPQDLLCHPHPQAGRRTKSVQCWRFHDGFFISGFPVLDGIAIWVFLLTSRAPSSSSRGWARVPRQAHPSGGQGGQRGCREALPACRPREPGEEGRRPPPQPRSWSWKLSVKTPYVFGEVWLGKGSNRPTWILTVWHHQIAVEALEGPRQTFILLPAATLDLCIWTRFRTVDSLVWLRCLSLFCQMLFDG